MWKLIYNVLLNAALPVFIPIALAKQKIRKSLLERLWGTTRPADLTDAVWIHAASVGEAVIAQNMITYMDRRYGIKKFLVTTNTYYTRDFLRKKIGEKIAVFSLPFDLGYSLRHFMGQSVFRALIIVETELWPNLIWQAKRKGIPIFVINGRISNETFASYRRFSFFLKAVFSEITCVLAQSEEHRNRFVSLGMDPARVHNTGNLKYYKELPDAGTLRSRENSITFGSVKEREVDIVVPVIRRLISAFPGLLVYIAPRELHLAATLEQALSTTLNVVRYSKYGGTAIPRPDVVVVDTIGDLLTIYERSLVAFVGGSLAPYGGQNMLEPLFFGTPVLFGPHVENFREVAQSVLDAGAGLMVSSGEELYEQVRLLLTDIPRREKIGRAAQRVIDAQKQAMEETAGIIFDHMRPASP
jgi:3-deoxy-D-manno-octulosonic-acid transferase